MKIERLALGLTVVNLVLLGAGAGGSGLLLMDETTEPGVHIIARRAATPGRPATTGLTLTGADGRRRAIEP